MTQGVALVDARLVAYPRNVHAWHAVMGVSIVAMLAMLVPHPSSHAMHGMVGMANDPLPTVLTGVLIFALGCVAVAGGARLTIGRASRRSRNRRTQPSRADL